MTKKHPIVYVLLAEYDKTFVGTSSLWCDNPFDLARFLVRSGYIKTDVIEQSNKMFPDQKRVTFYDLADVDLDSNALKEYLTSFQEAYRLPKSALIAGLDTRIGSFRSLKRNIDMAIENAARKASKKIAVVIPPSVEIKEHTTEKGVEGVYGVTGISNYKKY